MARKIGSIILNWNGEKFIIPHIRMLKKLADRIIVIQGTAPWDDYKKEYNLSDKPDQSESLIRKYFPEIEIYPACQNKFGPQLYNQGLEILSNFDLVTRMDFDMFMTDKALMALKKVFLETQFDRYILDYGKASVNHYLDFDHGIMNAKEFDTLAVSPKYRFYGEPLAYECEETGICCLNFRGDMKDYLANIYGPSQFIDLKVNPLIHHFRGWKGEGLNQAWVENKIPNKNGLFIQDLVNQFNPKGKFIKCPAEIRREVEKKYEL